MFADPAFVTVEVAMVNVAVVAFAPTVTVAGTVALAPSEARLTTRPPVGAGPLRVTVPVEVFPPYTLLGSRERVVGVGARTVKLAWPVPLPPNTLTVTELFKLTAVVMRMNVPVRVPG
jgi:hypothetical protein